MPPKKKKNFFVRLLRPLAPLPRGVTPCKIFQNTILFNIIFANVPFFSKNVSRQTKYY